MKGRWEQLLLMLYSVQKIFVIHAPQKANMLAFYVKQKIILSWPYLRKENNCTQTCPQWTCYVAGHLAFANPF